MCVGDRIDLGEFYEYVGYDVNWRFVRGVVGIFDGLWFFNVMGNNFVEFFDIFVYEMF